MAYSLRDVRSLCAQTDLFIHSYRGLIKERDGYLVAETPSNPGYYWGNYLYFKKAPRRGDLEKWRVLFELEFSHQPRIHHLAFGWDELSPGDHEDFLAKGFHFETGSVLSLKKDALLRPAKVHTQLQVRPLESDSDWEAAIANQIACRPEGWNIETYRPFKRDQMSSYRAMQRNGHGHWYGAFLGDELVADCGLFFSGQKKNQLGRFQSVGTSPAHRRKGVCSALVQAVCKNAFSEDASRTLVIVAEEGEPADLIYRSNGFQHAERNFTLAYWPPESMR